MRPRRLELSGFTAFRDPTEIDFEDADLFALVGPTGAGKSSVIDAIVFALYGAIPRTGKGTVEPVISLGKIEARIRFDFTLGKSACTAVRVVRRTKTGASTAEARLEKDGEVVAGNADEVTEQVEHLIGLGFDHFTKCVVLPQGEFAAFLHDRPAERQKLLRELLDLSVYERMRDLANHRKAAAQATVAALTGQLEGLRAATPEALDAARTRLATLAALQREVEEAEPELAGLVATAERLEGEAGETAAQVSLVAAVRIPDGIDELAVRLARAAEQERQTEETAAEAAAAVEALEQKQGALPDPEEVARLIEAHRLFATENASLAGHVRVAEQAAADAEAAAQAAAGAQRREAGARLALEDLQRRHAAHFLAERLEVGEPCPVCLRTIDTLPDLAPPAGLEDAQTALDTAVRAMNRSVAGAAEADRKRAAADTRVEEAAVRVARLEEDLAGAPPLEELEASRAALAAYREEAKQARAAAAGARKQQQDAGAIRARAEREVEEARRTFDRTRDRLAVLGPPEAERRDLASDWRALAGWAAGAVRTLTERAGRAEKDAAAARRSFEERQNALAGKLTAVGLTVDGAPLRDVCVTAAAAATAGVERLEELLATAAQLKTEIEERSTEMVVAGELAKHLAANRFEAWLLEEALAALVEGANRMLDDLTDRAYALRVVRRDFVVIDHRNADETRSVKTLSGGETFLVSLALAMALAEQLASMAVHGGAPLESIFLDEGFGSLDAETLDTVASVIQELGARGRTVGIVTHVRELADQMPVRYVVRREPATATITREEAP